MDKKTMIIIVFGIIILIGAGVMAYDFISNKYYNQGINDGKLIVNQQIFNSLEQSGYVPYSFIRNNETYNVRLGVIQNE